MTEKNNKIIIAALSLAIIGLLAVVFFLKDKDAGELSAEVVAERVINYINENFMEPGMEASLINVSDMTSVYKLRLSIGGREFDSFASKDGMFLFPEGYDMREDLVLEEPQQQAEAPEVPDIAPQEMARFVACLADAGFMIYGAEWCPHCTRLIDMLGGREIVDPIYVECPENEELCREKGVTAYPTILINGEIYEEARTFEGFSNATGCPVL